MSGWMPISRNSLTECCVGLVLSSPAVANIRYQRQVHVAGVVAAFLQTHLADRFQERKRLDVTHRATDFDDRQVGAFGAAPDVRLDLVGNVRNHLHRLAEILATPLLLDHRIVDLAGREVVAPLHAGIGEALVVPEVEVGFGAVLGHEDLAVLERTHRSGIDVDVRVELEVGDLDAARLEDCSQRRGGDTLAQG
jgi:hypothetical protein